MDDVRAVMDSIGSARAILIGFSEGAAMSVLFAATYPERVPHLVLVGGYVRASVPDDVWREGLERAVKAWGTGQVLKTVFKSQATNADAVAQLAKLERFSSSPGALRTYLTLNRQVHAAGLNPIDYMIPKGTFKPILRFQLPATLGSDLAGVVVEVGSRVTRFKPGDAVFACIFDLGSGALAEFAVVPENAAALKPANLDFVQAASIPMLRPSCPDPRISLSHARGGKIKSSTARA
jgi:pimeloyl-ACP methyl ester carboxylesterase